MRVCEAGFTDRAESCRDMLYGSRFGQCDETLGRTRCSSLPTLASTVSLLLHSSAVSVAKGVWMEVSGLLVQKFATVLVT